MVSVHSTQYHHQPSLNLGTCPNKFLYYILKRLSSHTLVDIVFSKYLMQMVRCILHSNLSNPLQYWAHVPPDSLSQSSAFSSNMAALMGRLPRCKLRKKSSLQATVNLILSLSFLSRLLISVKTKCKCARIVTI